MINIKTDSRKVIEGDTFVAIKGYTVDGHDYITDAIKNGATKIICEHGKYEVETIVVKDSNEYLKVLLKNQYSDLINQMKIIGITGTNGKTTTCYLAYNALNMMGKKVAYFGTIGFYINGSLLKELPNTTPEILSVYNMMLEAKQAGCEYVVMEASSHALYLERLCGLKFDIGVFTNLTKDHLDFHKNFENYSNSKRKLFESLKNNGSSIINIDDEYSSNMLLCNNRNITYGFGKSNYQVLKVNTNELETKFFYRHNNDEKEVISSLSGKHNVYNVIGLIALLCELGFCEKNIIETVKHLEAPSGRMQKINYNSNTIIIDYAHTPDAVMNIIKSVKNFATGNVYTLIGCGGDRDKTKRPEMAKTATNLSDYVILTSDNPRTERPEDILNDMTSGLIANNYEVEIDRLKAIKKGLQMLKEKDILLLLGKGHETYQIVGKEKFDFDEVKIVKKLINK